MLCKLQPSAAALNQQFEEELDLYRRREKKTCSIGVYRRRGNHFMVPLLQALDRELPEIRFEFQVGSMQELEQMLESRKLDYVLVTHLIRRPGWEYLHVCRDELMLICPEGLRHLTETVPDSPYPVLPVERLSPEKLISPGHKQSIYPFVERFLADYGRNPVEVRSVANMEIAAQLVSAGSVYCFALGSYRLSFAHIPSLMFCRPQRTPVPISWPLASVAPSLLPRQTARLKEIIRTQTAAMAGQKDEAAAEVSVP